MFDPFAAMEPDAPILHPDLLSYEGLHGKPTIPNVHSHLLIERGDLEQGFAESDLVLEHTFTTPAQHQGYIEPYSVLVGIDASGRPDVWMSNKGPFHLRAHLAAALDMPEEWVRCNPGEHRRRVRRQRLADGRAGGLPARAAHGPPGPRS